MVEKPFLIGSRQCKGACGWMTWGGGGGTLLAYIKVREILVDYPRNFASDQIQEDFGWLKIGSK
jgi:hypothetical protein